MDKVEVKRREITIVLEPKEGLILLSTFKMAIDQLTILLNEVASEISEPKPRKVSWGISQLSMNSPARVSVKSVEEDTEDVADRTAISVIQGITKLRTEKSRPQYFSDAALESAQRLARLTADNLVRINVFSDLPDSQVYLVEEVAVNVTGILEYLDYRGSVEGMLELISGREGQPIYFRVQDRVNNVRVRCAIPDELLDMALNAFRKRVIVSGVIKSDNSGIQKSIQVENIEIILEQAVTRTESIIKELEGQAFRIQPYG